MKRPRRATRTAGSWAGRHRRPLIAGYLAALGLVCLTVLLPPLRGAVAETIEGLVDLRREAWRGQIADAEALVAEGRHLEAEPVLETLDRRFPARTRLHALDRDRERILHALGETYRALDRKGRTLDAYRRAVAFDPLNVANRFALASAALHFAEPAEAAAQLEVILDMYPPHAGATRELIALEFEDADYEAVAALFERYVGAFRVHAFPAVAGGRTRIIRLPVDGRPHEIHIPVPPDAAEIELRPAYPTVEIETFDWRGRALAGAPGIRSGSARPLADGEAGVTRFALGPDPAAVRAVMRAGIPLDTATWERVETSYRNLLRSEALGALRPRLALLSAAEWDAARTEGP